MAIDLAAVRHGLICLTFDDGLYEQWLPQLPLFAEYRAHATFFFNGLLEKPVTDAMKQLQAAGHAVGIHTVHHRDADSMTPENETEYLQTEIFPQMEAMRAVGLQAEYFAYPNNARTPYSELVMKRYFRHCRAGICPAAPKGYWIADQPQAFIGLDEIAETLTLGGCGIGDYYLSTCDNLDAALERTAAENKLLVFFSHGISADASTINMKTAMLEHLLRKAAALFIQPVSFADLP